MSKKSRTELLSPYNSIPRARGIDLVLGLPDYKEKLKEGYPLRTKEELEKISEKYSKKRPVPENGGITFEEINEEQGKKSPIIKLKKATFRKYIQDNLLPKSIGYTNIGRKRMALFPNDIINHVNYLYYVYQVADDNIFTVIKSIEGFENIGNITFFEAIESSIEQVTIDLAVGDLCGCGDPGIIREVEDIFANKPDEKKIIIEKINKIANDFNEGMNDLNNYLKDNILNYSDFKKE